MSKVIKQKTNSKVNQNSTTNDDCKPQPIQNQIPNANQRKKSDIYKLSAGKLKSIQDQTKTNDTTKKSDSCRSSQEKSVEAKSVGNKINQNKKNISSTDQKKNDLNKNDKIKCDQNKIGQSKVERIKEEQVIGEQQKTEKNKVGQSKIEENKLEENKAVQNKVEQNKVVQNKVEPNKIEENKVDQSKKRCSKNSQNKNEQSKNIQGQNNESKSEQRKSEQSGSESEQIKLGECKNKPMNKRGTLNSKRKQVSKEWKENESNGTELKEKDSQVNPPQEKTSRQLSKEEGELKESKDRRNRPKLQNFKKSLNENDKQTPKTSKDINQSQEPIEIIFVPPPKNTNGETLKTIASKETLTEQASKTKLGLIRKEPSKQEEVEENQKITPKRKIKQTENQTNKPSKASTSKNPEDVETIPLKSSKTVVSTTHEPSPYQTRASRVSDVSDIVRKSYLRRRDSVMKDKIWKEILREEEEEKKKSADNIRDQSKPFEMLRYRTSEAARNETSFQHTLRKFEDFSEPKRYQQRMSSRPSEKNPTTGLR